MKLWTIYRKDDIERNKRFIDLLNESCKEFNIENIIMTFEDLSFGVINNELKLIYNNELVSDYPDGVINRTNDYLISKQLELKGIRCFNNSFLTQVANNKNLCYQYVSQANVKIQDTLFNSSHGLTFPLVFKNPKGRGGNEVYLVTDEETLNKLKNKYKEYTLQSLCWSMTPKDLRVYVINNKIVTAVLRKGIEDFRANYSISKSAELYELNEQQIEYINRIISLFSIDYAGIDFLVNDQDELIFNEIEDSVGARALYELSDINIAYLYIKHIHNELSKQGVF